MNYQIFPELSTDEYKELKEDIKNRGVKIAIEFDEKGAILDGHHRLKICKELKILDYPAITRYGLSKQEKRLHIRKLNLARRHLNQKQKQELIKEQLKETPGISDRQIAKGLGLSPTTVGTARNELEEKGQLSKLDSSKGADGKVRPRSVHSKFSDKEKLDVIAKDKPELIKDIDDGKHSVNSAFKEIKKKQRKEENKKKQKAALNNLPNKKLWKVTDNQETISCDVIITDPPYGILQEAWEPKELKEFTFKWAAKWNRTEAEFIFVFWSQRYLFEGKKWFDSWFNSYKFQQLLIWHYANNKSPQSRKGFKQTYEPIFFYRKNNSEKKIGVSGHEWGKDLHDFDCHVAAVPQSNFNNEDLKQHPAQKPLSVMKWLVNASSDIDDIICDPFCGSGTTGIAATQLGRRFHGIEKDKTFMGLAKERLALYGK